MSITAKLRNTPFEGLVTRDQEGFHFREDIGDQEPGVVYEIYSEIAEDLKQLGLELVDSCIEHDCISGMIIERRIGADQTPPVADARRIIVALDADSGVKALGLTARLDPSRCRLKVGKELFTRSGPGLIEKLRYRQFEVFLDLAYHDIPTAVAGACRAAADLGVWMVNVHALGGRQMIYAAARALAQSSPSPFLVAVTVLTSLKQADLTGLRLQGSPLDNVLRLARLARQEGAQGVVCSALEASTLRQVMGQRFLLVASGIGPADVYTGDQQRIVTPAAAVARGSDYLVIGRPITGAADPMAALDAIEKEISVFNACPAA